jgi:D-alanyl-D-alanine carboxypeptidase
MKKSISLVISVLLLQVFQGNAQIDPQLEAELQSILDSSFSKYGIEGVGASLILPDGCEWTSFAGERAPSTPIDPNRTWHFASCTKPMAAAIVLQLHEAGVLDINDPIHDYLDTDTLKYVDSTITIKMLLNHTTNLGKGWGSNPNTPLWNEVWADRDSVWNLVSTLDSAFMIPQVPNPSKTHRYLGHINYLLLGFVIEAATGNTLAQEFQSRIFTPLNLIDSYLGENGVVTSSLNGVYNGSNYNGNLEHHSYLSTRGAGAYLISKPNEYAQFIRAFHSNNLVSSNLMDEARMKTLGAPGVIPGTCIGTLEQYYGYGTQMLEGFLPGTSDTLKLFGHGGVGLGVSYAFHYIDSNVTLVLTANDYASAGQGAFLYTELWCAVLNRLGMNPCVLGQEENIKQPFNYYPNPGNNTLRIDFFDDRFESIEMLSITGKLVLNQEITRQSEVLETAHLPEGIYLLVLKGDESRMVVKWIKQD